jgi:hypothetical protein
MGRDIALYLYALGLVLPPVAVFGGLLLLALPRRTQFHPLTRATRTA